MILQSTSVGRLVLTSLLGRGGMGLVFSASCPDSEREFAVKMLAPAVAQSPEVRARFEREALILGSLGADGVVQVHDHGETPDGVPFMVMDRVAGRSLDKLLSRKRLLTMRETRSVLLPLLRTLAAVHESGVSHRDIKPANIMLHCRGRRREVTLIDFGVAETCTAAPQNDGRTAGTLHYMSPEQAFGTAAPSPRDDLWAIAVVAYQCLTGLLPFDGATLRELCQALDRCEAPPVTRARPDLSPAVDAFFRKALNRKSSRRFATCEAMIAALTALPCTDTKAPRRPRAAAAGACQSAVRSVVRELEYRSTVVCRTPWAMRLTTERAVRRPPVRVAAHSAVRTLRPLTPSHATRPSPSPASGCSLRTAVAPRARWEVQS
ncbi:MAG: serine/threonine-protein kinase [Polyangiaceae bacterium]